MARNGSITFGDVARLSAEVRTRSNIIEIGKRRAARIFVARLLELDEAETFDALESAYRTWSSKADIPEGSEAFWTFVEKSYLHLKHEPRDKFYELCLAVNEDLAALAKNLAHIRKEKQALEEMQQGGEPLTGRDRYYKRQLEYFEKKNLQAREEITEFMTHEIKHHAIMKASVQILPVNSMSSWLMGDHPYAFRMRNMWASADPYDVNSLDEYSNKFMDLPVSNHRDFVRECRSSPEHFRALATAYINGISDSYPSAKVKIGSLVQRSHILDARKAVIETMLRHFEAKDYISFVSMAPMQIEGIFADICREVDVSEKELVVSSVNDKLDHIVKNLRSFTSFEYYAFKFPVLRNQVAHGGLVDGDQEDTAIHLMLDLLPVCELAVSDDLPITRALKTLQEASTGNHEKLVEWLDVRKSVKIPGFYNVQEAIENAEAQYTLPSFWDYLESQLKQLTDVNQIQSSKPRKAACSLKNSNIAVEHAERFLKASRHIVAAAIQKRDEVRELWNARMKPKNASIEGGTGGA
ncbi:MAG: hypothetical protein J0H86_23970 [Xanthomonadaceae bacterium]|nr:hypothetical protein [Xanthomonadaceae bacterium]